MALDRLPAGFALAYIDDIICHSKSIEDHLDHVEQVMEIHSRFGMKLRLNKCHLFKKKQNIWGTQSLPLTGKDLKSFLGFTGYYRSFIKEYSFLTAEMNKMKQDDTPKWDENTKLKFEKLKKCFADNNI